MKITEYKIKNDKFDKNCVFALISDLHGNDATPVIEALKRVKPDYILAAGDIFEHLNGANAEKNRSGFELLSACAKIAPTFFAPGNHEVGGTRSWSRKWKFCTGMGKGYSDEDMKLLRETGAVFLDDGFVTYGEMAFGGLGTGLINENGKPDMSFLEEFCNHKCPKILLCHHPEYYERYLADKDIDIVVSGHAHGGQWRFFGRGVFAPGQGLFPKYTSGIHDGRLVISKGLKKGGKIPRIFNSPEVVKIVVSNH